ncbi:MAG TPA: EutN/CcmL family microcompartment protein [Pseudomonadota bacterium]|nr:EutN/CcmL family microcompartment protein [Pseudomonadota bacterium]
MKLCRVLGPVVATAKHPTYHARKLLSVQPVDEQGADSGASFLAVDDVQAGVGDIVLVMQEGNGVRQLLKMGAQVPIRSLIVGIVDQVTHHRDAGGAKAGARS